MQHDEIKPLPQNIEAEQAVLGAVLLDPETMDLAMDLLSGDEFFSPQHGQIFETMQELYDSGTAIDVVSLAARLQSKGQLTAIGGVGYLTQLIEAVPTSANLEHYAEIVKDKATHREAILELRRQLRQAEESEDTGKLLQTMQAGADKLTDKGFKKQPFHMISDVAMGCFDSIERTYHNRGNGAATGLPSGFADLDKLTNGFQKSDLIIVAARPSVGKTAFALNIAQNVGIRKNEPVAVFSLEMGAEQLVQRMICAEANVDANRLRTGFLEPGDWEKITAGISLLSEAPIYIDDSASITVGEIRAKCRRLKKDRGLGLILIDYLQLIAGTRKDGNRQQEVSEISRTLKQIAREFEVPVIALSQLSRTVEQRQDKRPMMSDLRESGSLEQDADIVAFLYRDDYYDKESEKKNIIEIIIAKQRNGPVGTVELAFLKNFNKFANIQRDHHEQTPPPGGRRVPDMRRRTS
ncbi:replicative DNA helicase [Paenibacillus chitinolyticus]|uniref:replicative DNA helicase n=1 Tax=Paenibacillus chitinolyticus TaxID=79263 RepID=UPI0026E4FAD3|nr:replicative DNA helicase [Paenibacillus chitinolyticus]GKS14751.1 replicative DNA helicase [Paenibacillus chitinolyticus]